MKKWSLLGYIKKKDDGLTCFQERVAHQLYLSTLDQLPQIKWSNK
jgi:hypothetical protein